MSLKLMSDNEIVEFWRARGRLAPKKDGILTEAWQGLAHGATSAVQGFASTAEELGLPGGESFKETVDSFERRHQHWRPDPEYSPLSFNPADLARTITTGVGQTGTTVLTGAATTLASGGNVPLGMAAMTTTSFGQIYGNEVKDIRKALPDSDESTVRGLAFISSLGQGLVESVLGPEAIATGIAKKIATGALKDTTKKLGKRVVVNALKGGFGEGSEEVFQGLISNMAKRAGGADIPLMSLQEAAEQFAGGFWPGVVMGGAGGVVENNYASETDNISDADSTNKDKPAFFKNESVSQDEFEGATSSNEPIAEHKAVVDKFNKHWSVSRKSDPELIDRINLVTPESYIPAEKDVRIVKPKSKAAKTMSRVTKKLFGEDAVYFISTNPNADIFNGSRAKDGKLYINASTLADNPVKSTGHEFGHFIKQENPEAYNQFRDVVIENLAENHQERFEQIKKRYEEAGIKFNEHDEFTNDVLGEFFGDGKFWDGVFNKAEKKNAGLGKKLAELVLRYVNAFKDAFSGEKGAQRYLNNLDTVRDAAVKVVTEYKIEQKATPAIEQTLETKKENTEESKHKNISVEHKEISVRDKLKNLIESDVTAKQKNSIMKKLAKESGRTEKDLQEEAELAVVDMAREIATDKDLTHDEKFNKMLELYNKQPNFSKRTSTSVRNQAYSTPAPLAYIAGWAIDINGGQKVYEPTAGNGIMVIQANPDKVHVNELNELRLAQLKENKYSQITNHDASTFVPDVNFDRIIMNPPFGGIKQIDYNGYKIGKIDHLIALKALESLTPDGKATMILGANREPGKIGRADMNFMNYLYNNFNIAGNFEIAGELYKKQGAGFPLRVITINGRKDNPTEMLKLAPKSIDRLDNWNDIHNRFKEIQGNESKQNENSEPAGRRSVEHGTSATTEKSTDDLRRVHEPVQNDTEKSDKIRKTGRNTENRTKPTRRDDRSGDSAKPAVNKRSVIPGSDNNSTDTIRDASSSVESGNKPLVSEPEVKSTVKNRATDTREQRRSNESRSDSKLDSVKPEQVSNFQSKYIPQSSAKTLDTVIPRFMSNPVTIALRGLSQSNGSVDDFLLERLKYPDTESLHKALSAEQIDAVALAINNIEKNQGMIIGDQTGIGKGRQAASLIRYAINKGWMPVFFTEKPKLFSDMYFDGIDIGSEFKPFIIGNPAASHIRDSNNKVVLRVQSAAKQKAHFNAFLDNYGGEFDSIFITYSQINKKNVQQKFLEDLLKQRQCLVIMDETHNAAGDSTTGLFFRGGIKRGSEKKNIPNTIYKGVLNDKNMKGVVYLSATYAKRPDNMPLYFKTAISRAVDNLSELPEVVTRGGLPLQQIISQALAEEGQYIRRERDFSGVKYETYIHRDKNEAKFVSDYDKVTGALQEILHFSELLRQEIKQDSDMQTTNKGSEIEVQSFASVAHNYISQLLLSSKANAAVERTLSALDKGQKVVIGLTNTMGSFIQGFTVDNQLKNGDKVNVSFKDILHNALRRQLRVKEVDAGGNESEIMEVTPSHYGLGNKYNTVEDAINQLSIDLPISPIDYISSRLQQAGKSVGEITGRSHTIDYNDGGKLYIRGQKEIADKNKFVNGFNDGTYDVLIINQSGSTGLSLHASEKFKDQRQRKMIMVQPSLDINVVQQMFGRVLRSGQVIQPEYEILATTLEAEKRPMIVLNQKLKSLNANTTANTESAASLEGTDFLNKYGDIVAMEYLNDNPRVINELELKVDRGAKHQENLMRNLTGRMALLPNSKQKKILSELDEMYTEFVKYLKDIGEYDLEITTYDDWDVIDGKSSVLSSGKKDGSVFDKNVVLKDIRVKAVKKAPTLKEVQEELKSHFKDSNEIKQQANDETTAVKERLSKYISTAKGSDTYLAAVDRIGSKNSNKFNELINNSAGKLLDINIGENHYHGIITNFKVINNDSGNPGAASKFKIEFMVDDGIRKLLIPLSKINNDDVLVSNNYAKKLSDVFPETAKEQAVRENRKVITGNLIKGLEYAKSGKVVTYKKKDGSFETAILLPKSWNDKKLVRDPRKEFKSAAKVVEYLSNRSGNVANPDGTFLLANHGSMFRVEVPRTTVKGGKYFLNKAILKITDDFESVGSKMRAIIDSHQLEKLTRLMLKSEFLSPVDMSEYSLRTQANPGLSPEVVTLNNMLQDDYQPEHRAHSTIDQQVEKEIAMRGADTLIDDLASGRLQLTTDTDTRLALKLINSPEMIKRIKKSDTTAIDAMQQWIEQGSNAGRLLASRKQYKTGDPVEDTTSKLKALVLAPSKRYKHAPPDKKKAVFDKYEKPIIEKIIKDLDSKYDVDPFDLTAEQVADKKLMSQVLREVQTNKATWGDMAYEWWINSILSRPTTQAANIVGNTSMSLLELAPQRLVEATVNLAAKDKTSATFGEFKQMHKALRANWKNAFKKAREAFDLERPIVDDALKLEGGSLASIPGKLGRIVRFPGRLLLAADEFAKNLIIPIEASAMAYRIANSEGHKGQALQDRMNELLADDNSNAFVYADNRAKELTFQADPGRFVKYLLALRNAPGLTGTVMKYIFPFLRTPANIIKTTVRKSPLGSVKLINDFVRGGMQIDNKIIQQTAEQIIAWGVVMTIASMSDGDDEEPMITGSKPGYGTSEYNWKMRTLPPMSIRIGDQWYSYSRIEPLAGALAMIVDGIQSYRDAKNGKEGSKIVKRLTNSAVQNIRDKTFLQSIGDLIKTAEDPTRATRMVGDFASSWIPNLWRGSVRALDENVRNRKTYTRGWDWLQEEFTIGLAGRVGFSNPVPKVDLWGNDVKQDNQGALVPPVVWKLISPITTRQATGSQADRLIMNWNRNNPNTEYWPSLPRYWYRKSGKTKYMSKDQYYKFAKEAGKIAKKDIEKLIYNGKLNAHNPQMKDIRVIKKVFSAARKTAKEKIIK